METEQQQQQQRKRSTKTVQDDPCAHTKKHETQTIFHLQKVVRMDVCRRTIDVEIFINFVVICLNESNAIDDFEINKKKPNQTQHKRHKKSEIKHAPCIINLNMSNKIPTNKVITCNS